MYIRHAYGVREFIEDTAISYQLPLDDVDLGSIHEETWLLLKLLIEALWAPNLKLIGSDGQVLDVVDGKPT